ncbi:hypothetical protein [Pedobacter nyackensis]|uniref:Uncharacterized protein n=1 Tax=Pedobacter nyackensis TaxID=475255 RepID=A0A1W1ZWE2_9SPHI|nr:hypothetical protein [Pedobacter nyackensis]SMC52727.1 hypothetical protein SAMN04488101_101106 [Pedobacter nyackensis]
MLNTDLFKFPFISEVWGTSSDWVMVLVTGITAYFLWRTLRSQTTVQNLQQDLHRIEVERFIKDQNLKMSIVIFQPDIVKQGDNIINYIFRVEVKPMNGGCKNLKATLKLKNGNIIWIEKLNPHRISYQSTNDPFTLKFRGEIEKKYFLQVDDVVYVEIEFENLLGYRFTQKSYCPFSITGMFGQSNSDPIFLPN